MVGTLSSVPPHSDCGKLDLKCVPPLHPLLARPSAPLAFEHIASGRIAKVGSCAHGRRINLAGRTVGKPLLPGWPPRALLNGRRFEPLVRAHVMFALLPDPEAEPARMAWFGNDTGVVPPDVSTKLISVSVNKWTL